MDFANINYFALKKIQRVQMNMYYSYKYKKCPICQIQRVQIQYMKIKLKQKIQGAQMDSRNLFPFVQLIIIDLFLNKRKIYIKTKSKMHKLVCASFAIYEIYILLYTKERDNFNKPKSLNFLIYLIAPKH